MSEWFLFFIFYKELIYVCIYLTALGLSCGMRALAGLEDSQWQHVGSSSLIRDWTQAPCFGSVES